jgi:hypothetical protein
MSYLEHIQDGLAEHQSIEKEIVAEKLDGVAKPRDWEKATAVAYLRLIGLTQIDAAKGAGIGVRTLRRYEVSDWWPEACREAVDRWMQQLEIEARSTVMQAVKEGDVATAWKVLERIDRRLAPPRQLHGVEHRGEVATNVHQMSDAELTARATELANRWTNREKVRSEPAALNGEPTNADS